MMCQDKLDELAGAFLDFEFDFIGPSVEDALRNDGGQGDEDQALTK